MNFDTKIRKNIIQGKIQNFEIKSTMLGYANKGNMQSSVYDPNQIVSDAFDMDNMIEGNENKILTSIERTKLEEIEEGAEVNVQSDMAQTDDTKDDFVKNKPTIVISGNDFNRTFDNLHVWFNITTPYLNKPSDMIQDTGNISVYMPYEGSSNTGIQVIHGTVGDDEGKIWMRRCNSGTWTKWKLVAGGGGFSVEAISNTTAATADKIATTASGDYIPKVGNVIKLVLTNANTANNVTLNIDNSGAKNITIGGNNAGNISINNAANGNILLLYDGTNYIMFGAVRNVDDNTTYTEISTTEITDGTASTTRSISGRRSQDIVNKAREKVIISTDETFKDFITKTQAEYNAMSSVERANKTIIVDEFDSSFDIDTALKGWYKINCMLSYASADSPTFVINTAVDLTSFISVGMKMKLTQLSTTKFFVITAINSTTITLYGGTDYALLNAVITNAFYSMVENPYGWISTGFKRKTRFVPLSTLVTVVNVNQVNTSWNDVDVTAYTSANCYAISGRAIIRGVTPARFLGIRPNGSTNADNEVIVCETQLENIYVASTFITGVDTGQIFEYLASSADINSIIISIDGYWEYVD